jgi:Tol biopolymer transport system component
VFSGHGRRVAFTSRGSDFGPADTGNPCVVIIIPRQGPIYGPCDDVYVRDLVHGTTTLASTNAAGTDSSGSASYEPSLSADGTKVTFTSGLRLPGHSVGGYHQVYVRDLTTATTELVSVDAAGTDIGAGQSDHPLISPDGTKVAFLSTANNLGPPTSGVPGNAGSYDLYLRDLTTGVTTMLSANHSGTDGGRIDGVPAFSGDGSRIAFNVRGDGVVPGDTNGHRDVFVRDLETGETILVSYNAGNSAPANGPSWGVSLDHDGTTVAFTSGASDLGSRMIPDTCVWEPSGERQTCWNIYVRDLDEETTALASIGDDDRGGHGFSDGAILSADGERVVFSSEASNLGSTDTNGTYDVYVAEPEPDDDR